MPINFLFLNVYPFKSSLLHKLLTYIFYFLSFDGFSSFTNAEIQGFPPDGNDVTGCVTVQLHSYSFKWKENL